MWEHLSFMVSSDDIDIHGVPSSSIISGATVLSRIRLRGVYYRPVARSHRDSNLMIRQTPDDDGCDIGPARLLGMFRAENRIVLIVERHKPLNAALRLIDPYHQFGFIMAGSLFHRDFLPPEAVPVEDLICPFAMTPYKYDGDADLVHVLPLPQVRTQHVPNVLAS